MFTSFWRKPSLSIKKIRICICPLEDLSVAFNIRLYFHVPLAILSSRGQQSFTMVTTLTACFPCLIVYCDLCSLSVKLFFLFPLWTKYHWYKKCYEQIHEYINENTTEVYLPCSLFFKQTCFNYQVIFMSFLNIFSDVRLIQVKHIAVIKNCIVSHQSSGQSNFFFSIEIFFICRHISMNRKEL